ncbi:RNA 2',3'-cyclic phosphodiesterase [Dehalogenimonas sp. THU2]|uniref:RNA 2',3'-cyclic phosphodiesterase n=1 Tax=Dehalogenimonas sp. THU2 TaxID=3151121 RepID=UPI003218DB0B
MTDEQPIRAFIAVELPEAVKREIGALQKKLAVEPAGGIKWVAPGSVHLTLKFLGWVVPERIDEVKNTIARAVEGIAPFELGMAGVGAFPNLKRLNVVWCGLTGDLESLEQVQKAVEEQVSPLGFPTEKRAFSPHLTLARLREDVSPEARSALAEKLAAIKYEPGLAIPVASVSLMQSRLLPDGAVYTRLGEFPLTRDTG